MWKYFILNQKLSETGNYFWSSMQIQMTSVASESLFCIYDSMLMNFSLEVSECLHLVVLK